MKDQLGQLLDQLARDIKDPFNYYALALEYQSRGNRSEAVAYFEMLLNDFPEYIPTYRIYGQLLQDTGSKEKAAAILHTGLQKAKQAGDTHAASEMTMLLDELINE